MENTEIKCWHPSGNFTHCIAGRWLDEVYEKHKKTSSKILTPDVYKTMHLDAGVLVDAFGNTVRKWWMYKTLIDVPQVAWRAMAYDYDKHSDIGNLRESQLKDAILQVCSLLEKPKTMRYENDSLPRWFETYTNSQIGTICGTGTFDLVRDKFLAHRDYATSRRSPPDIKSFRETIEKDVDDAILLIRKSIVDQMGPICSTSFGLKVRMAEKGAIRQARSTTHTILVGVRMKMHRELRRLIQSGISEKDAWRRVWFIDAEIA